MTKRQNTEHGKAVADAEKKIQDIDRHRCQYTIDGIRCIAFGTICETAQWDGNVKDPFRHWLCPAHYRLRGDHLGSREVIADLAKNPQKTPEDWRERMLLEHGLGELQTAWRDMNDEQKRILVADTILKARKFVRPAIAQPAKSPGQTIHVSPDERTRQLDALYRAMTHEERAEFGRGAA